MLSSAYLRLLLFLLAILIPACNSSSFSFHVMCSVCKLNKQGDNKKHCCTPFSILNQLFHAGFWLLLLDQYTSCENPTNCLKSIAIQWDLFSFKREENPVSCYNMDEPWGHYAKWNKPVTNTVWFHFCEVSKIVKSIGKKKKRRIMVTRGWGGGEKRRFVWGCRALVLQDENVQTFLTTMWIYLILLNCTLKNE